MGSIFFSSDPQQALRMQRHLAAVASLIVFTLICMLFYSNDLFVIDRLTFSYILIFFWAGVLLITLTFRLRLNKKFPDPSLTVLQIVWGTSFLLTITYSLNESRGLTLMPYFGMLSVGFFKLRVREFLSVAMFAILGYTLIILYMFIYEPDRINIKLELLQLLAFVSTITVMLFTGSSIHHLRERTSKQRDELQAALELNRTLATTDELTGLYNRRYFMKKLAEQKVPGGRVKFLGSIYDPEALSEEIFSSAIYVLAGMGGLSINETMAFGLPVICSRCDGTETDLIADGENGLFFKEGDAADLAAKIDTLLLDPDRTRAMGEKALKVIVDKVNLETVAQRFMDCFQYVMVKKP